MLKNIFSLVLVLTANTAMAGEISEQIYGSLNVEEIDVTPQGLQDVVIIQKRVGGLTCQRTTSAFTTVKDSHCVLAVDDRQDNEIYAALNVKEETLTPQGMLGSLTLGKTVGALECTKSTVVYPNAKPNYSCKLN